MGFGSAVPLKELELIDWGERYAGENEQIEE